MQVLKSLRVIVLLFATVLTVNAQVYPNARTGGNYMHNYYLPPSGSSTPWWPSWSPDGQWIAFADSPVVAINRAIAIAERGDAYRGLASLNAVAADARLRDYQPYWAARALLLTRTEEVDEADAALAVAKTNKALAE